MPADGGARALSVGDGPLPVALRGRRSVAASLDAIEAFRVTNEAAVRPQPTTPGAPDLAAFVRRSTLDAYATADRLAASRPSVARIHHIPIHDWPLAFESSPG